MRLPESSLHCTCMAIFICMHELRGTCNSLRAWLTQNCNHGTHSPTNCAGRNALARRLRRCDCNFRRQCWCGRRRRWHDDERHMAHVRACACGID